MVFISLLFGQAQNLQKKELRDDPKAYQLALEKTLVFSKITLDKLNIKDYSKKGIEQLNEIRKNFDHKNFPKLKNDNFLRVFRGEKLDHFPCWMMRQAGRYLPEFREVKKKFNFFEVCENPFLSGEVTLQPIERFNLDASIIFSDILVIPKAMGQEVQMQEKVGPVLPKPIRIPEDINNLRVINEQDLEYVYNAVFFTRIALDGRVPLIGFCGAAWTLMTYMVEGKSTKQFIQVKKFINEYPKDALRLLDMITDSLILYMDLKVQSGAQVLQIFDSFAGELSPRDYKTFSLNHSVRLARELKKRHPSIPIILFAKGQNSSLVQLFEQECFDGYSIDWSVDINLAKQLALKYNKVIQGNLDPGVLLADPDRIKTETINMINILGKQGKYVVNLGHGLWPNHDPKNVEIFTNTVREYGKLYCEKNDTTYQQQD